MRVVVLYEDSRKREGESEFTFHRLVVRAVADRMGIPEHEVWRIALRIDSNPRNGNANVLEQFRDREQVERLQNSGPVVAVLDRDRIRDLVPIGSCGCKSSETRWLASQTALPDAIKFVLLEQNLESLINAIRSIAPELVSEDEFRRAARKELISRDNVFKKAASRVDVRRALLDGVPSFAYLVNAVVARLGPLDP